MLGNNIRLGLVCVPTREKRKTLKFTGFWIEDSECSASVKGKISPRLKAALIPPNKTSEQISTESNYSQVNVSKTKLKNICKNKKYL